MAKAKAADAKPGKGGRKPRPQGGGREPGVPDHPQETRDKFRAHYLLSGVVAHSAKFVGVPEGTCHDWVKELLVDPEFVEDRRAQRAKYLEDMVAMRHRVAIGALERFEAELDVPEQIGEGAQVTIIDKRPDYGKLVLDAEKNAHALAKLEKPEDPDAMPGGRAEVTINIRGPSTAAVSG
jgi:hypothetical protein